MPKGKKTKNLFTYSNDLLEVNIIKMRVEILKAPVNHAEVASKTYRLHVGDSVFKSVDDIVHTS